MGPDKQAADGDAAVGDTLKNPKYRSRVDSVEGSDMPQKNAAANGQGRTRSHSDANLPQEALGGGPSQELLGAYAGQSQTITQKEQHRREELCKQGRHIYSMGGVCMRSGCGATRRGHRRLASPMRRLVE